MEETYWELLDEEVKIINALRTKQGGTADLNGEVCQAELDGSVDSPTFKISRVLRLDRDDCIFNLQTESFQLKVTGFITGEHNTVNRAEGWADRHSYGKIDRIQSENWVEDTSGLFRTYYHLKSDRFIYDYFGFKEALSFSINSINYRLLSHDNFLVVETTDPVAHDIYAEAVYNLMVVVGFITGKFIQDHNYTFQGKHFLYRRLRQGSDSIYHALTWNAHGYKDMLGREKTKAIADSQMLKALDTDSLGRLAELCNNHHAIQYALVLFNEANSNKLSLLVKNSCFYTVLEVLRKFFYHLFKADLPPNYTSLGNIPKFKAVFGQLAKLTASEETMLTKRNAILHGEVDDLEGSEMVGLMQMQLSLIYRLLLTHVGFNGYVIDHYALRNEQPDNAFVKLN
ncbi:hypothetical protein [Mucilaginibacter sp. UR6-11]|uniref:hypothetical protein n=1 Tax=Mucilaginibacter sp. UR6-11 TaxID=1435644 RepID=UPI001E3B2237|nr:hypothetical protein [Mucilaginibacter sp. UR6-11]MCC8423570.1 hypothetical protein [Mucilaginibacter sp. UR6-11]